MPATALIQTVHYLQAPIADALFVGCLRECVGLQGGGRRHGQLLQEHSPPAALA